MILDEVVLHNVGPFRSRNVVVLTPPSRQQPITLIGGLNGNGKTTLLDAVHLCFYGRNASFARASEVPYEEQLRRLIHRGVRPEDGACAEVAFRSFEGGAERAFRVKRNWSVSRDRVKERVEVDVDGVRDPGLSDSWSEEVQRFLPANLADLFFFDGERIEGFADPARSGAMLAAAVHSLLGVDLVKQLAADLDVLIRRRLKGTAHADVRPELDELEATLTSLEQRRADLLQQEAARRAECGQLEARVQTLELKLGSDPSDPGARRRELDRLRAALQGQLESTTQSLVDAAAGCLPIALVRGRLGETLELAHTEAKHRQSTLLAGMLTERDERVAKELRREGMPASVVGRIVAVLADDRQRHAPVTQFEPVVAMADVTIHDLEVTLEKRLPEQLAAGAALLQRRSSQAASLDELERRLVVAPDDRELDAVSATLQEVRQRLSDSQRLLRQAEEVRTAADAGLSKLRARESQLTKRQREADQTTQDTQRFAKYAGRAQSMLDTFRTRLITQRVRKLEQHILAGFRLLMRKEGLVQELQIDPQTCQLRLLGLAGEEIHPSRLSAGERQLLATAILWGLGRASGRPVPVVIDTPLGRLDSKHRELLADRYFPNASHQVVLLSTDEEIDAALMKRLSPHVGRTYRLVHDDASGTSRVEQGYFW